VTLGIGRLVDNCAIKFIVSAVEMKKTIAGWVVAIVLAILAIFLVVGLGAALDAKGIYSSEAAGWMQALGAFSAIFAAVLIAENGRKTAVRQHQAELAVAMLEKCERQVALLVSVKVLLEHVSWLMSPYQHLDIAAMSDAVYQSEMERIGMGEVYDILRTIPLHELDRAEYAEVLLGLMRVIRPGGERRPLAQFRKFIVDHDQYLDDLITKRRAEGALRADLKDMGP